MVGWYHAMPPLLQQPDDLLDVHRPVLGLGPGSDHQEPPRKGQVHNFYDHVNVIAPSVQVADEPR